MQGINTSNFRARDWRVVINGGSGPVSYTVKVDRDDGSFIFYRPSG